MKQNTLIAYAIPLLVHICLAAGSLFIVEQGRQALVLKLGRFIRIVKEPGLQFPIPFQIDVVDYDKRIFDLDMQDLEATLGKSVFLSVP